MVRRVGDGWLLLAGLHYPAVGPEEGGTGQAGKVAVFSKVLFWEPSHPEHGLQIQVRVWNNSPLSIIDPALYGIQLGDFMHLEFTTLRSDQPDEVLLPGESAKIEFENMDHIDREQLYVTFSDANGVDWKYKLTSHRLSKLKFKTVRVREGGILGKAPRPVLD